MIEWSTDCQDWETRLINRQSIIPPPIYPDRAEEALSIFKRLRVVDLPGKPTFGECCDEFVFDFVAAIFGAYDVDTGRQLIRKFFLLISKKNTKSTIAAGIMITAVLLCWREEEEHLILAPTKEVADNSFKPAASMIRVDPDLMALFHVQDHIRTITHRVSKASLKVVAADTDTVSGKKAGRILVDEYWLFGKRLNADSMFMEATGGQVSREEGWVIYLSTQSEEPPAGVFKDDLNYMRAVRDGIIVDKKALPVLYEFPEKMIQNQEYLNPKNFYITNPNLGRSVSAEWIEDQLKILKTKSDGSLQKFLSKHLNIEIGMNLRNDRWAGADYWEKAFDPELKSIKDSMEQLENLLSRCEVAVAGIDGGGLDDLLALSVVGREIGTRKWMHWAHAWAHKIVLERRKDIATKLLDFQQDGDLTIVDLPGDDVKELCDMICIVKDSGLLPDKNAIGVDAAGISAIVDELTTVERGITFEQIVAISQGWKLNGAIKTTERKLAGGEFLHCASNMMMWCVGNARITQVGNAISITKQASGTAKIDPLMATLDADTLLALNPAATAKKYQMFFV